MYFCMTHCSLGQCTWYQMYTGKDTGCIIHLNFTLFANFTASGRDCAYPHVYACLKFHLLTYVHARMDQQVSSMLLTIQQFVTLENAGIDELDVMFAAFQQAVEFLKTQPYDILDFVETGKAFDKDFEEFTEKITLIEVAMRDFISQTFEEVQNIELALDLLSKLEVILQRDSLKGDLENKYTLIFQHYGDQLERVQLVYEGQKANPPLSRNLPPVLYHANFDSRHHSSSVSSD